MWGKEFDKLWIWEEPELKNQMQWYRDVEANRMPAKFRIAEQIPLGIPSIKECSEDELWGVLEEKTTTFLKLWNKIRQGKESLPRLNPSLNLLDLCCELSQRMLTHCNFCRWNCEVDRSRGTKFGTCKLAEETRVSTYFHHLGEELIYRGRKGSGTIFFTSCNMRCAFCQNGDISTDKENGLQVSARALATMAWLLRMEGCHNINWVGGEVTIHLHTIVEAISLLPQLKPTEQDFKEALPMKADSFVARIPKNKNHALYQEKFNAPLLWNSNFFMSQPTMKILRILMDVWLPDLKFGPGKCAVQLSRTPWYWETITSNVKMIYEWGEEFSIRHLVMPNHVECCTRSILEWLQKETPNALVNIMDQYHPDNFCDPGSSKYQKKYEDISRRTSSQEILRSFQYAKDLDIRFEAITYEKNTTGLKI